MNINKNCKSCKEDFEIEEKDLVYYQKIDVPLPNHCPKCRLMHRLMCCNAWSLFYRNCDKCGKRTLSMYKPEDKITVYCQPCWWSDKWDGTEFAMDYDPKRSFFEQLRELSEKTPYSCLETEYLTLKNCDFSNALAFSKNCILASWADYCENVCYSSLLNGVKDTADSLRIQDSELCYESIGINKSYRIFYSEECDSCTDVWFSRNCYSSLNCVGCVNQRGSSYKIFNVQYSKEDYFAKLKELKLETRAGIEEMKVKSEAFFKQHPYRNYSGNTFNVNVTGEYVYQSKNSQNMYICNNAENCKDCQFITVAKASDCMDYSGWGNNAELIYNSISIGNNVSNVKFSVYCFPDVLNTEYSMWCIASKNNFGCVNLKRKSYCILNKQYSKEEFEILRKKIIEDMKINTYTDEKGRTFGYGDFFVTAFSKFEYNNSNVSKFFPKTKSEVEEMGFSWYEEPPQKIESTLKVIPESIAETPDSITDEVLECKSCQKKYKIALLELSLLKKMNLPIPIECIKCRENKRFRKINMPIFYDRFCDKCGIPIKTSFNETSDKVIYCEKCYQNEVS